MAIKKPESDRTEISSGSYEPVAPGDYVWQFTGGISIKESTKEGSGWKGINFPVEVVRVVNGDEEALESKGSFSFTVLNNTDEPNQFIDETMGYILGYTDLLDKFLGKYGEDIDYTDQAFVDDLNIQLTGKTIGIVHWNQTKGEYTNMRIGTWYKDVESDDSPIADAGEDASASW